MPWQCSYSGFVSSRGTKFSSLLASNALAMRSGKGGRGTCVATADLCMRGFNHLQRGIGYGGKADKGELIVILPPAQFL